MTHRLPSILTKLETNSWYQYGLLAIITLLAAGLRFYKLGEWSFWIDEIYTIDRAQSYYGSLEAMIHSFSETGNWIPLSFLFTASVLKALGTSEWSARLVSAVIGIISVPILYFPVKRLFGPCVGLIAAILLAISPWHIYWSQNARFYTSLMLLFYLALFAIFFGLERDRPVYLLLSFILLYLAASEREVAMFAVPVVICYLLVLKIAPFEKPAGLRVRNLVILALPVIAFLIFEIYSFVTTGSSNIANLLDIFAGQVNHSPLRLLVSIVYRISIPLVCLGFFGGVYLLVQRNRAGLFLSSAAWVPPLALLVIALFSFTIDRYVFMTLPFWIIMGAVAVHELVVRTEKFGKILSFGVLLLLIADSLSQDALYYSYQKGNRPDWRGAFALVGREKQDGDLVASTRPEMGRYYLGEEVKLINSLDPKTIMQTGTRVWFVIDEDSGWVAPELAEWIDKNSELIDVLRVNMPGKSLSIIIYLYEPARASPLAALLNYQYWWIENAGARASPSLARLAVRGRSPIPVIDPI